MTKKIVSPRKNERRARLLGRDSGAISCARNQAAGHGVLRRLHGGRSPASLKAIEAAVASREPETLLYGHSQIKYAFFNDLSIKLFSFSLR